MDYEKLRNDCGTCGDDNAAEPATTEAPKEEEKGEEAAPTEGEAESTEENA